jgi:hypothetical protein
MCFSVLDVSSDAMTARKLVCLCAFSGATSVGHHHQHEMINLAFKRSFVLAHCHCQAVL